MGARDLFKAYIDLEIAKDQLLEFLTNNKFPNTLIDNNRFDYYDCSLELDWVPEGWAPSLEQLKALLGYGFDLLYVNYEDKITARLYNLVSGQGGWSSCANTMPKERV